MTIESFIAEQIRSRLDDVRSLVVYDPDKLYAGIVNGLQEPNCTVVDGAASTIEGRERAEHVFRDLISDEAKRMIVYVPVAAPLADEGRRRNPYQAFVLAGGCFPGGDGESFHGLCRQAVPDRVGAVDALFAAGRPDFATVNNLIAGSTNWPKLKTLLGAESAVEIVVAILSPSSPQEDKIKADDSWVPELKQFLDAALGLKLQTKAKRRTGIAAEIWRFILFSEFTFDLPGGLPEALHDVPRADKSRETLVYGICDRLRGGAAHQIVYMESAETVAADLQLLRHMQGITDLGDRDTFAFEERIYLGVFKDAALSEDYAKAEEVSRMRNDSIWVARNGERKQLWTIADRALQLIKQSRDLMPVIGGLGQNAAGIVDFYCNRFHKLDSLHRSFEQAVADAYGELDSLNELVPEARVFYRKAADMLQVKFLEAIARDGWPVEGRLPAREVFGRFIAPWVKERKKTAYFLVDAFRYELAAELINELPGAYKSKLDAVCAQLPGTTPVGMAALMPAEAGGYSIELVDNKLVPFVGKRKVVVPNERLACVQSVYGDLCGLFDLDELVTTNIRLDDKIQLMLVKTTDIDAFGESNALEARRMLPQLMQKLLAGVRRVAKLGVERVVFATDHGFILLDDLGPGNAIEKPPGDWTVQKDRFLFGKGSSGTGVRSFDADKLDIPCPGMTYAVPTSLGSFSRGNPYFHGGMSLQECVLPVLSVELGRMVEEQVNNRPEVGLSYKGNSTSNITTRRPMIEISAFQTGLFDGAIEFSLAAYAGGELVGEAGSCDHVNSATGLVNVKPSQAIKVPLRMDNDFQGAFEVRAMDPETRYNYAVLKLKTDYLE